MEIRHAGKTITAILGIALAAPPAMGQSSVQLWGVVDLGVAHNIGSTNWTVQNGAASRIGIRGDEDLGDGMRAFFDLENRTLANNGSVDGCVFWCRHAVVGLSGKFGRITLGREDTPILKTAVHADPWWYDTVAGSFTGQTLSANDPLWINNALTYTLDVGPLNVMAQVASKEGNLDPFMATGTADRSPKGMRVTYAEGPLFASAAYWDTGVGEGRISAATVKYDFGPFKPYFGVVQGKDGKGHVALNDSLRNLIVGVAVPIGVSTLNASYDRYTDRTASTTLSSKFGVGYFHFLSKLTILYTNVTYDSEAQTRRSGFDMGIQHQF